MYVSVTLQECAVSALLSRIYRLGVRPNVHEYTCTVVVKMFMNIVYCLCKSCEKHANSCRVMYWVLEYHESVAE